jgi:hypothetical protein
MSAITTPTAKCSTDGCGQLMTQYEDPEYVGSDGKVYCGSCREHDLDNAATIHLIGPSYGKGYLVKVGDLFVEDFEGEEPTGVTFTRKWVSSDSWRGYHQTNIVGWYEIADGWTTGWPDDSTARKVTLNDFIEAMIVGGNTPPVDVCIILDSTSNVFSTAVGIHVKDHDAEALQTWLSAGALDLDGLRSALR